MSFEKITELSSHYDNLETMSAAQIVAAINREDHCVADAVERALPQIARFVELLTERMRRGGRLFYIGAGTSGRLGVLDASEIPPTFGMPPTVVVGIIAGGDTALRSARLIIAEFLHLEQHSIRRRIYICIPVFAVTLGLLWFNIADENGFNIIWNYFGWANQTLAVFTLWAVTVYLVRKRKFYWITLLPAIFMTAVCTAFLLTSDNAFGLPVVVGNVAAIVVVVLSAVLFVVWKKRADGKLTDADKA